MTERKAVVGYFGRNVGHVDGGIVGPDTATPSVVMAGRAASLLGCPAIGTIAATCGTPGLGHAWPC
jgi:hypothetical protein